MLSLIKKSLIWIVSGTASIILTACYGSPMECRYWASQKIRAVDANNTPIPGLYVTHRFSGGGYQGFGYTDENGEVKVHACEADSIKVTVEDVDGERYGSFDDKTVTVDLSQWFDDDSDENVEIVVMGPDLYPGNKTMILTTVAPDNDPIPALEIINADSMLFYTDQNGQATIPFAGLSTMRVTIKDVDFEKNGSFLEKSINLEAPEGDAGSQTVVIDPATGNP